ncbi:MAG: hypothetical protein JST51_19245 [Armatimonadetes bacterium]|nr:hypothetical protein [Armatimonadota bacterium]
MSAEDIPIRLAREVLRVGSMDLWQYQAFVHHEHPSMGSRDALIEEPRLVAEWTEMLSTKFPNHRFVISVLPCDRMTWYQVTSNSPTEDDVEFEEYSPPFSVSINDMRALFEKADGDKAKMAELHREDFKKRTPRCGSEGACENCRATEGFTEPRLADGHRGIRLMTCRACGAEMIHSTKTIRFLVGRNSEDASASE